jgi:hypothetical protein
MIGLFASLLLLVIESVASLLLVTIFVLLVVQLL